MHADVSTSVHVQGHRYQNAPLFASISKFSQYTSCHSTVHIKIAQNAPQFNLELPHYVLPSACLSWGTRTPTWHARWPWLKREYATAALLLILHCYTALRTIAAQLLTRQRTGCRTAKPLPTTLSSGISSFFLHDKIKINASASKQLEFKLPNSNLTLPTQIPTST